jgi:hypothetical protein
MEQGCSTSCSCSGRPHPYLSARSGSQKIAYRSPMKKSLHFSWYTQRQVSAAAKSGNAVDAGGWMAAAASILLGALNL